MPQINSTRYAALGLLSLEPMSGYDIKKMVDTVLRHFWSESYGRLYPTLKELKAEGLVRSRTEKQKGKPDRNVYTITKSGRRVLSAWLEQPAALPKVRVELLLKLFFAHNVPLATTLEQIRAQRDALSERLAQYDHFDRMVEEEEPDPEMQRFFELTILHGRMITEARVRWCDEALKRLGAKKLQQREVTP